MKATSSIALAIGAILLLAACASEGLRPQSSWDPDAPVVPIRERPSGAATTAAPEPPGLRMYVVMLPDAAGEDGALDVITAAGTKTLDRPGEAIDFEDPSRVIELDPDRVASDLAAALAAEPPPPESFAVYFETGGTRMTAASERGWQAIAAAVAGRPVPEVTVTGHADRAGSERYNDELSRRRAEAIRDRLVAVRVDPALITLVWFGETRPAVATADGIAEPRNRRVEIRVR